jgi:hypothetical protein
MCKEAQREARRLNGWQDQPDLDTIHTVASGMNSVPCLPLSLSGSGGLEIC